MSQRDTTHKRKAENEAAERAVNSINAQDAVDISGRSEGVKK